MIHADLFSGIGGFSLAARAMNWETAFHCEIEPFCQRVLKHHFPESFLYENIFTTDFTIYRGRIDLLTGGFPCQPFSVAGLQNGAEDHRHLWPEMLRAIRQIQPRWIVAENVPGLISNKSGVVFEQVCTDLENEGYEVQTSVLPALGVDSPHIRYRVFIIAYSRLYGHGNDGFRENRQTQSVCEGEKNKRKRFRYVAHGSGTERTNSGPSRKGLQGDELAKTSEQRKGTQRPVTKFPSDRMGKNRQSGNPTDPLSRGRIQGNERAEAGKPIDPLPGWRDFPTQSPLLVGNDGLPDRLDGITVSRWRRETIKAAGNSVIPALVYEIFKVIDLIEKMKY